MSFEEEWAGLHAEAASRPDTGMRLNHASPGTGGGGGPSAELVVRDDELGAIGNMAFQLFEDLREQAYGPQHNSVRAGTSLSAEGLQTGAALSRVLEVWDTQTKTLKEACAHISNHLDYSKKLSHQNEDKISTVFKDENGRLMTPSRISDYID